MKKIPTLFVRDPKDRSRVIDEVTPGYEWVIKGEGRATRKLDGTCARVLWCPTFPEGHDVGVWMRREVKSGGRWPTNFTVADYDSITGKTVGWEPAWQTGFAAYVKEAVCGDEEPGTYELCGPKINGNPEHLDYHVLIKHGEWDLALPSLTFEGLRDWLARVDIEGIVWWHEDGRMCKLKKRDFGLPRAATT